MIRNRKLPVIVKQKLKYFAVCFFTLSIVTGVSWCTEQHSESGDSEYSLKLFHSLILITIDTLRADKLGSYGYADAKTPNLDFVSRYSTLYTDVLTDVPITLPAHCSLLTGLSVSEHNVRTNMGYVLSSKHETLATFFRRNNAVTAAFIGGYPLTAQFGLNKDFNLYDDKLTRPLEKHSLLLERPADEVINAAHSWLQNLSLSQQYFVWIHLYDPHSPYVAPKPFDRLFIHPYDGEVCYTDFCLGQLLRYVSHIEKADQPRLIVTADHGEALGDHGEHTHGIFLYQSTIHIPLIIKFEYTNESIILDRPVISIQDIFDLCLTSISLKGIKEVSTSDFYYDPKKSWRYIETYHPHEKYGWSQIQGIRMNRWKYLSSPIPELYDLMIDPLESSNLINSRPNIVKQVQRLLASVTHKKYPGQTPKKTELDGTTRESLEALGYLLHSSESEYTESMRELPDPKQRINCLENIENGDKLVKDNKLKQAMPVLEEAFRCDPTNPDLLNTLALVYQNLSKLHKAEKLFRRAIELQPSNARFFSNLGSVLKRQGKIQEAIETFKAAQSLDSSFLPVQLNLAVAFFENGQQDEACQLVNKVLQQRPNWDDAIKTKKLLSCSP